MSDAEPDKAEKGRTGEATVRHARTETTRRESRQGAETLEMLRCIAEWVDAEADTEGLAKKVCEAVVSSGAFPAVWLVWQDSAELVGAGAGFREDRLQDLVRSVQTRGFPECFGSGESAGPRLFQPGSAPCGDCVLDCAGKAGTVITARLGDRRSRPKGCIAFLADRPPADAADHVAFAEQAALAATLSLQAVDAATRRRGLEATLGERVKEQTCLYEVARLSQKPGVAISDLLRDVPDLLPPAWRFPERACARVRFENQVFSTCNYRHTPWSMTADLVAEGQTLGSIDVAYVQQVPPGDEGPFLREKRWLLDAVAGLLSRAIGRRLAERRIRESEERFRHYFEASPIGMAITAPDMRWLQVNRALCDMLGYSRDELLATSWDALTHPDEREHCISEFRELLSNEMATCQLEKRFLSRGGATVHVLVSANCVRTSDGSVSQVLMQVQNTSDLWLAQESLERQRKQLLALFDGIEDIVFVCDPDTCELLYVNGPFQAAWGGKVGARCHEVIRGRDSPCAFCANVEVLGEQPPQTHVWEWLNEANGRWYRCMSKAIQWPDERLVFLEIATDITERKRLEEDLEVRQLHLTARSRIAETFLETPDEEVYGKVLDIVRELLSSPHGVFGYLEDNGAWVCPSLTHANWDECNVPGKTVRFPYDLLCRLEAFRKALYENHPVRVNEPLAVPVGHVPIRRLLIAPIAEAGKVLGAIALANASHDYTEKEQGLLVAIGEAIAPVLSSRLRRDREEAARRQAEANLVEVNRRLQESNRELEQFAYVASHDLQEPLRMVSSYTQLLADRYRGALDEKADKYIHYAVDGARRMHALIGDLLDYSRVTKPSTERGTCDLHEALGRALVNLQAAILETGAEVTNDALPSVDGDCSQLARVFQNLLSNAIKFRSAAPPRVHVSTTQSEDFWVVTVQDNGIGIDPKYRDRVFQVFQRLHPREAYPGTGIGLAIVRRIIENHGGRVWFDSEPGRGAAFHFTLPADGREKEAEPDATGQIRRTN